MAKDPSPPVLLSGFTDTCSPVWSPAWVAGLDREAFALPSFFRPQRHFVPGTPLVFLSGSIFSDLAFSWRLPALLRFLPFPFPGPESDFHGRFNSSPETAISPLAGADPPPFLFSPFISLSHLQARLVKPIQNQITNFFFMFYFLSSSVLLGRCPLNIRGLFTTLFKFFPYRTPYLPFLRQKYDCSAFLWPCNIFFVLSDAGFSFLFVPYFPIGACVLWFSCKFPPFLLHCGPRSFACSSGDLPRLSTIPKNTI